MNLIEERFNSLSDNGALFERDNKLVAVSPYISDERWKEIKPDLEQRLNEKLPLLIEKFGVKK